MKQDNIAEVAQYWNNISVEFDQIYTGRKSPVGRALDKYFRKDMFQRFEWVMRCSGDVAGQTVCDVGCGSGRFATALAKKGAARVVGVDIAPNMVELSRKLAAQEDVSDVCEFIHADVLDWRTNETFDEVIAIGFWDYIMDPLPRLEMIRKLTKNRFLSAWPRLWTWRMPVRKARLLAKGCPVYFFSKSRVYALLEQAGFKVNSCKAVGKLFCVDSQAV